MLLFASLQGAVIFLYNNYIVAVRALNSLQGTVLIPIKKRVAVSAFY